MTLGKVITANGMSEILESKKDVVPNLFFYDNVYYAILEDKLYALDSYLHFWQELQLNMIFYDGMSVTVTPKGVVFFGGQQNRKYTNTMYLFTNPTVIPIINDMPPRAYHSSCWIEHLESICIACGTAEEPLNQVCIFNMNTWATTFVVPLNPLVSINSSCCHVTGDQVGIIGNFNSLESQDTNLILLNIRDGRMNTIESSSAQKNFTAIKTFVMDNRFFAVMAHNVWVYDFAHGQWLLFDVQKLWKEAAYILDSEGESLTLFTSDLSRYVNVTFKTMVRFVEDLIDDNINTNLFEVDSLKISNRVDSIFKSVHTNAHRVVAQMKQKGMKIPAADRILRLMEEHRLLQMAAFRLDDARTRLGMVRPQESNSENNAYDVEKQMADIEQKLKKYRADKLAMHKSHDSELVNIRQAIQKIDRQVPGPILPGQNPLDVAEALADSIKKQKMEYEKLKQKCEKDRKQHVSADSFFYGIYELDKLDMEVYETDKKLLEAQKAFTEAAASSSNKWLSTLDSFADRNGQKQFAKSSAIERWITTEREHYDILLSNLRAATSFLKAFPDSPKALSDVQDAANKISCWIQRLNSSAPSEASLIEEIYMNISWASSVF
ncbi:hypothetical protein TVAG_257360 [Trichomonas vaginalis G3]|uniref:Uncharacterized protein n=1 Tax=Trichomonas vaginalis (strain ATCC PRA-98 / G3) TaxID=412133 RepID=A2ELH0_TRIV3|nr:hypothetical protein TVAGG3_0005210 [Trichomonas vaginalis G3]EAY06497.1 hypothetical protein TVAG_257360 [Trichomonas vaginalis G3]KAI5538868.1 hypothetical protein TVAGG3_0005210 [Trichomonas vaginalis G3]|eukprot:XP_001318720.1 hypothetical protein [Trichomonas vaginalis G3]